MKNDMTVDYNYKGFTIFSPDESRWSVEPTMKFFDTEDCNEYGDMLDDFLEDNDSDGFKTIKKAKSWIDNFLK